jgi:hypothetical protein
MVNPGVMTFFTVGYMPAGSTQVSFDYNCDGKETESGDPAHVDCALTLSGCGGDGYIAATPVRTGSGVDQFCGSDKKETCAETLSGCVAGSPTTASSAIACN